MSMDGVAQVGGAANGVVSRRAAVPENDPTGGAWDHGIGVSSLYVVSKSKIH